MPRVIGYQLSIVAANCPDATALVFGTRRQSYAALNRKACRLANAMRQLGIGRGDRVVSLCNNTAHFFEIFFAAAKLGAIFVPLNFRLAPREIIDILDGCRPRLMFLGSSLARVLPELHASAVCPERVVEIGDQPDLDSPEYEAWLQPFAADEPEIAVAAAEPQLLVHSSGTTGRPKGAIWTHLTTLASSQVKIIDFRLTRHDVTAVFGPLFHVGPLMDLAVPVLLCGGTVVVAATTGFDPARVMRTIADERVTVVTIYPTMWRRVLGLADIEDYDSSSLRLLFTGGEPIPLPVLRGIYRRFPGAGFVNTYGSTEGGPITTFLAPEDAVRKIGSVGKPAFGVEVRIANDEGGALGPGEAGELLVRSAFVCAGYWEKPDETAAVMRGGWWHTNDLAWRDDEGFIWIGGRKTEMIISGAENIYPVQIEQVIAGLDPVAEVAVVGVPDDEWGEAVAAFVVLRPGAALDADAITAHCRRNLAGYKRPRHIRFIDELPRTTVNKVAKTVLRERFIITGRPPPPC